MNMFMPLILSMLIPMEELRFVYVYKQGFDTSCGIAVTTTLLNKYWNVSIPIEEMYQEIINLYTGEDVIIYTVNFSNISDLLRKHEIQTRAYKMDWDELAHSLEQGFAPVIIHYETPYSHFALLLYIENNFAFVLDPARGYEIIDNKMFMDRYSGNVLLAASRIRQKDNISLQQAISEKQFQFNRLQQLARRRW